MSALAVAPPPQAQLPPALPGVYADPPSPEALAPHPETVRLVRDTVKSVLLESPGFHALDATDRRALAHNLVRVGSYLAECVRDDWYQSGRIGQRPIVRLRRAEPVAAAQAASQDFAPAAANQIGRVTGETLHAIAFPVFVSDLIKGVFNAIGDATQQQMDQYMQLLANVSGTVDQFMANNVSDDNARHWLAERYPQHIEVRADGHAGVRDGADERPTPTFRADLDLDTEVPLDDGAIEDTLVPAARRRMAQSRLQLLSSLVLMGINRIVITGGKIRATMGFHINTRDQAHQENASQVGVGVSASGSGAIGPFSIGASASFSYVSSSRADSNAELNVQADLTGEVEIHFQSDYFPIQRFATAGSIDAIRSHTPVPSESAPTTPRDTIPWGDSMPTTPSSTAIAPRAPATAPFVDPAHPAGPATPPATTTAPTTTGTTPATAHPPTTGTAPTTAHPTTPSTTGTAPTTAHPPPTGAGPPTGPAPPPPPTAPTTTAPTTTGTAPATTGAPPLPSLPTPPPVPSPPPVPNPPSQPTAPTT